MPTTIQGRPSPLSVESNPEDPFSLVSSLPEKGIMDARLRFLCVLLLVGNWACEARPITRSDLSGLDKKVDVCTLCEEYASLAVDYLTENKTQAEIIEALHLSCSQLHTLKEQCITLVDYYATLFFTQLSSVQPDEFCKKVNLCQAERALSFPVKENSCDACHHVVDEILIKLKDPETKFDVVEILSRGCNAVENQWKKCKVMVHKYTPVFLSNAEKYVEKTDICATLHACSSQAAASIKEKGFDGKITMVTSP